jgi:hypothetical protein
MLGYAGLNWIMSDPVTSSHVGYVRLRWVELDYVRFG